jgi:hypothetical protein
VLGIISLALLVLLVILISIVPVDNFWNKILATCYIVAVIAFLAVLGTPKTGKSIGFCKMSIISFVTWCVIIPVIAGIFMDTLIFKIAPNMPIDDVGFWSIAICVTILSFIWFLTKLYKEADVTSYLDLYSTAWIAVVTILTTLFDLQEKRQHLYFYWQCILFYSYLLKVEYVKYKKKKTMMIERSEKCYRQEKTLAVFYAIL